LLVVLNGGEILCNENNSILIPQNLPKARSDNNSTFLKKTFAWCFWDHEILDRATKKMAVENCVTYLNHEKTL
jgi:hypothetical protein